MVLRANGKTYVVHVFYDPPITEMKKFYAPGVRRGTHVKMHEGTCNSLIGRDCTMTSASAMAECSEKDQFERRKGRKIALGRAMVLLVKDISERKELWEDFRRVIKEIPDVTSVAVEVQTEDHGNLGY